MRSLYNWISPDITVLEGLLQLGFPDGKLEKGLEILLRTGRRDALIAMRAGIDIDNMMR